MTAVLISTISIGGYVFAQETSEEKTSNNSEKIIMEASATMGTNNYCGNRQEMIQIMRENGYGDMAKWMEEGDFESMDKFMNNLTDEDYQKMIDLMNQNGYGDLSGMMNIHNSMTGDNNSKFKMMGNMMNRF